MTTKIIAAVLVVVNALVWGSAAAIYCWLWLSMMMQNASAQLTTPLPAYAWIFTLVLLVVGPLQYCAGFVLSVAIPVRFIRKDNGKDAIAVAATLLLIGVPDAGWGILMLGST
jgi:hypothetical protein